MGDTPKPDVNYVFPTFVTTRLPPGLVGLIIAAIFAAAMSATAGELSATASATIIDIYRAYCVRTNRTRTIFRLARGHRFLGHRSPAWWRTSRCNSAR